MQHLMNTMAGWHFTEDELAAALSAARMLNPSIDLSNPCNLNCAYCFIEEKNSERKVRRPDELSLEETLTVIDDFARAGAKTVNIVGAGEPTIDPHFCTVIDAISDRNMIPVVFTNGIRIAERPELASFLAESGTTVVLKYNTIDAKTQDLVAGRRGYAAQRDKALDELLRSGLNAPVPTRLALDIIAFRGNYDELLTIHRFCRRNNLLPVMGDFIPTGRTADGLFVGEAALSGWSQDEQQIIREVLMPLTDDQRRAVANELRHIDHDEFSIGRAGDFAYYSGVRCTQLLGVYVDISGKIWPCVARSRRIEGNLAPGLLGSIRDGDMPSHIWHTHTYLKRIRDSYTGDCPYKSRLSEITISAVPQDCEH